MRYLMMILMTSWMIAAPAFAIDYSGTCTGTIPAAGSPHQLTGTCTVPAGETLTVEAGAILNGNSRTLNVDGTLNASGATFSNVRFQYRDGSGGTLENSTLNTSSSINFTTTSAVDPAAPVIRNNTISGTSTAIAPDGTARPTIEGNVIEASSRGIVYGGSAAGTASGNQIGFPINASSSRIAIEVNGAASPILDGNTLLDDPGRNDTGIELDVDATSAVQVVNNDICATGGDTPLRFDARFFAESSPALVSANNLSCGVAAGFGLYGMTASDGPSTLAAVDGHSGFLLISTLTVSPGQLLTIASGVELTGSHRIDVEGILSVDGASFDNADVLYRDGSGGVLENSTFTNSSSLSLTGSSVMDPAEPVIRTNTFTGVSTAISVSGTARPAIENNTFEVSSRGITYSGSAAGTATGNQIGFVVNVSSGRVALDVNGAASPILDGNTILDDPTRNDTGIELDVDELSAVQVVNNDICATGGDTPLRFDARFFAGSSPATVAGNIFSCGTAAGPSLDGTTATAENSTLAAVDGLSSFVLTSTVTVSSGQTLTIASGIELTSSRIDVDGTLNADGATFTNLRIRYRDGSGGILENSTLSGSSPIEATSSSAVTPADPTIRNNSITATSGTAIHLSGTARPVIAGNTLVTNSRGIVYNGTSAGSATGNQIGFEINGSSSRIGIEINGAASPTVDGNAILDDPGRDDTAIELDVDATSTAQVTNNDLCTTGEDHPLQFDLGYFAEGSAALALGNVLSCEPGAGFALEGRTGAASSTLAPVDGQSSFILAANLTVDSGHTLTVPAGLRLDGSPSYGRNLSVEGLLQADGATFDGMSLIYRDGSGGTVQNCTLSGSNPIDFSTSSLVNRPAPIFRANTITATSIAIDVVGAAEPTIENNVIETDWRGLRYWDTSGGTATGNQIRFTLSGSSSRIAVEVNESASPVIEGNSIFDDPAGDDIAIHLDVATTSSVQVLDNDLCVTGGDTPIRLSTAFFADTSSIQVAGNVLSCGPALGFALFGVVDTDSTVAPLAGLSELRLNSTLTVSAGSRLALEPGLTIDGDTRTLNVDGTLEADGVDFTDIHIRFRAGSGGFLKNSQVLGMVYQSSTVEVIDASPSFEGNVFDGSSTAVRLDGTTGVLLDGNVFRNNNTALHVQTGTALSTVSNNTFDGNTLSLSFANADALFSAFPAGFGSNLFTGAGGDNLVLLPGSLPVSGTIPSSPVAYKNISHLRISNGAQVLVQGGTVIASTSSREIVVEADSRLVATGTPAFPVVFTDFDASDGNRWRGLTVHSDDSLLQDCIVEFGQGDGLTLESASMQITGCVISDHSRGIQLRGDSAPTITGSSLVNNLNDGLWVNLATAPPMGQEISISNSSILGNGSLGVRNGDNFYPALTTVQALNNYWGHDSGPFDNSDDTAEGGLFNPGGQGENVSDDVWYDPWIRIGPTVEGSLTAISGGGQTGTIGAVLPEPLVVEVLSTLDNPLEGIEVIFSIASGDATLLEPQPVLTGADGRASVTVQLGLTPGEITVAATARDVNSPLAIFEGEAGSSLIAEPLEIPAIPGQPGQDGDVNGDGGVNLQDAALIEAVLSGWISADSPLIAYWDAADINLDGLVNPTDVLLIQGVQIGTFGQASGSRTGGEPLQVHLVLPEHELHPGDTFEVPVYVDPRGRHLVSYGLRLSFDARALRILDVEGGVFPGFAHGPTVDAGTFLHGVTDFTANSRDFRDTPRPFEAARIRFEVRASEKARAEISLRHSPGGGLVDRERFLLQPVRFEGHGEVRVVPDAGALFDDGFESGNHALWDAAETGHM